MPPPAAVRSVSQCTRVCGSGSRDWSGVRLTGSRIRRVYEHVDIRETDGQFEVTIDGRAVVTPAKRKLLVPTAGLAHAIALEWDMQGDEVKHQSMLLTTLAATAIDDVQYDNTKYTRELLKYIETDAVCLRHSEPEGLAQAQAKLWDPVVAFGLRQFGVAPVVTHELVQFEQDQHLVDKLQDVITALDHFTLIATHSIAASSKSLLIAMAVLANELSGKAAARAAVLEEQYQIDQCGLVQGYHDLFLAKTNAKIAAASLFLRLLHPQHENALVPFLEQL